MNSSTKKYFADILTNIESEGLFKKERVITSPQSANIEVTGGQKVLNMCANNYLGLSNNPEIIEAAKNSYDKWGY
ncbi:MAG TPA: glycine C-acetyltransferase, partial [Ignavibacteriaceae bacterium]